MTGIKMRIKGEKDAEAACAAGREVARSIGMVEVMEDCLTGAIKKLTQEALREAGGGVFVLYDESDSERVSLRLLIKGGGEGIRISFLR